MSARLATAVLVAGALLAGGCAAPIYHPAYEARAQVDRIEYGIVENIEVFQGGQSNPVNLGTILGGVAGGVIGHQIGGGRGNTAATIAGTIGGAVIGNEINKAQATDRYRVIVRLDSGATLAVPEVGQGELRIGDRVRVINNRVYRA